MSKKYLIILSVTVLAVFFGSACSNTEPDVSVNTAVSEPIASSNESSSLGGISSDDTQYCYGDPYYETATSTFYAKILSVDGKSFHVQGLDVNDINFRSEYTFSLTDETRLQWRGVVPKLSDFQAGCNIAVTFSGRVLETFPGQLVDVELITILEPEIPSSSSDAELESCYGDPYYETATKTFYAKILSVDGKSFHVRGLDVNDINYQGEFTFSLSDETRLYWCGTVPNLDDFDAGDTISITFKGSIAETFPGQINNVELLKLLDDEK